MAEHSHRGPLASMGDILARKGRRSWNLTVIEKSLIAPRMTRVVFRGDDLDELEWRRGQDMVLEIPHEAGIARRHYTIRYHDADARTLAVDFVLHGTSPATTWVRGARPGATLVAAGPRGRTVLDKDAAWHLFVGDETCIPAIFAMLEGLPNTVRADAFIEIDQSQDALSCGGSTGVHIEWLCRNGATPGSSRILFDRIEQFALPPGHGHAYIIGETSNVRALRQRLIMRGLAKDQISAEGYWRPGRVGGHDHV